MTLAIQLDNVSKKFGRKTVLNQVSLQVPTGCVFALLGENGAGKSTLIRGLLGYHRFDNGSVRVLDLDPVQHPMPLRRRVGYVADAPGLYEWMNVRDAGWYAAGFYPPGFMERYLNLLKEFELPTTSKIRNLSKGMRAKVSLSLAMAFDPSLLILDEPTSGLDPLVRRTFLESMVDRAAAGQTVFLSSHQIHEVERVADWIAILHEGTMRLVGRLDDLKSEIRIVRFSMRDTLLAMPAAIAELQSMTFTKLGRTVQLVTKGWSDDIAAKLEQDANIFDISAVRPNLEELYIAFTRGTFGSPTEPTHPRIVSDVA
ncbi:MAG: ABC transporter ATP-binding protein [Pirellulales bacterium]